MFEEKKTLPKQDVLKDIVAGRNHTLTHLISLIADPSVAMAVKEPFVSDRVYTVLRSPHHRNNLVLNQS